MSPASTVMLGDEDINYKVLQVATADSRLLEGHPDLFERLEGSDYFKSASEENQKAMVGRGLYITKDPVSIGGSNATYQNFINGMMNTEGDAIKNGLDQTGSNVFTLNYNPSHGFVGDLGESMVDKFLSPTIGLTTGVSMQTGEYLYKVTTARGTEGSNFACHSQGCLVTQAGIEYRKENGGFQSADYFIDFTKPEGSKERDKGTPTVGMYGSPVNTNDMGRTVNSVDFTYRGSFTHDGDAVGELLGGNKGWDGQMGNLERIGAIADVPKLFMDNSPHSTYQCSENPNAKCGEQP